MKLCLGTGQWCEEDLDLTRQLGIQYVSVVNPDRVDNGQIWLTFEFPDLYI